MTGPFPKRALAVLRDPTIVFFLAGALLLLGHRLIAGDGRTIAVTQVLRSDLTRQFQDLSGHAPSVVELDTVLQAWKRDEALYREALREGLDRDDAMIRARLIEKVREQITRELPLREPSSADLEQWLARHRALYEQPFLYEHEYAVFPKIDPKAPEHVAQYERALNAGATPSELGIRTTAANVSRERIEQEFGSEVAAKVCALPAAGWRTLENSTAWLLVRMIRIEGGLPKAEDLRERLVMDWKASHREQAVNEAAQAIVRRYRFQEQAK